MRQIRWLICSLAFSISVAVAQPSQAFVRVRNGAFEIQGNPYRFVGANLWQGMHLASAKKGDRKRLVRELDALQKLGITNLRVFASSEGPDTEAWRVVPTLQPSRGKIDTELLEGLDFLLEEMSKRSMFAVVCLNNFWPWSGGMAQYLNWAGHGPIPYPPPEPNGTWDGFQSYAEKFYSDERAIQASFDFWRVLVSRYSSRKEIMAWELANEPRGGSNAAAYDQWIGRASAFIRSLDRNHLITTGSEGETPWPMANGIDFKKNHRFQNIDYVTIHIWAQNWSWYDPHSAGKTYDRAVNQMRSYVQRHLSMAKELGKPLVLEEFGLARDEGRFDPSASTAFRDRYYREVFEEVYQAARRGEPAAGVNFWAWAGETPASVRYGNFWRAGDALIGDPPHETQGWYSVFSSDLSTLKAISDYAKAFKRLKLAIP